MKIRFYQSPLCPRCYAAKQKLRTILKEFDDFEVEEIDAVLSFNTMREDDLLLFPALVCGEHKVNGVLLTEKKIRSFLKSISPKHI